MADDNQGPRRSARQSVRAHVPTPTATVASSSYRTTGRAATIDKKETAPRKTTDPDEQLRVILHNPKSPLVELDLTTIINPSTFAALSLATRGRLSTLLPPTAFPNFVPTLGDAHPSYRQHGQSHGPEAENQASDAAASILSETSIQTEGEPQSITASPVPPSSPLSPPPSSPPRPSSPPPDATLESIVAPEAPSPSAAFFSSPFFLSAARTFQDHLYTGWRTPAHDKLVRKFQADVHSGVVHVPWKDEVWLAEQQADGEAEAPADGKGKGGRHEMDCKLSDLANSGLISVGDILVYKRRFTFQGFTVEKDILITSCDPNGHSISMFIPAGPSRPLPPPLADVNANAEASIHDESLITPVTNPTQLEHAILDADGRVPRGARPNGNAWKAITVWRSRRNGHGTGFADRGLTDDDGRDSRENHGTLFYLRSCYYADR